MSPVRASPDKKVDIQRLLAGAQLLRENEGHSEAPPSLPDGRVLSWLPWHRETSAFGCCLQQE